MVEAVTCRGMAEVEAKEAHGQASFLNEYMERWYTQRDFPIVRSILADIAVGEMLVRSLLEGATQARRC